MSDTAILAIFAFLAAIVTAVPATIAALNSRQARNHAQSVKDTIGERNGNGDAMAMLARSLGQNLELLAGQEHTAELEAKLLELSDYTHRGVHRLNGQVGMMWREWAKQHGYDPDTLPDPQPSPEEKQ